MLMSITVCGLPILSHFCILKDNGGSWKVVDKWLADAACSLTGCMREDLNGDLRGVFFSLIKETPEIISHDEVHRQ